MCNVLKFPHRNQWGSNGIDIECFGHKSGIFNDMLEYQVLSHFGQEYQKIVFLASREKS
jgi:hypothetical protein